MFQASLGNIIIVWRAQTLWKNHYIMVFLKGIFIITTSKYFLTFIFICNIDFLLLVITILNCVISNIGDTKLQSWEFLFGGYFQTAQWELELITNLVVTILIACRAWFVLLLLFFKTLLI